MPDGLVPALPSPAPDCRLCNPFTRLHCDGGDGLWGRPCQSSPRTAVRSDDGTVQILHSAPILTGGVSDDADL
jgi:hypothetical protein